MKIEYCCWCGEDLEVELGRQVYVSDVDESLGHMLCIEKYDKRIREIEAKKAEYEVPKCEACSGELVLSKTILEEVAYYINSTGETERTNFPIGNRRMFEEKLHCLRCSAYYKSERNGEDRIIRGKKL